MEALLWDDLHMTAGQTQGTHYGNVSMSTQVQIVNASHPLAGGLASGSVTVTTAGGNFKWAKPPATAIGVATIPMQPQDRYAIFGYTTGTTMSGQVAPARRVGLFADMNVPVTFNDNGWKLFDAAVRWAAKPEMLFVVASATLNASETVLSSRLSAMGVNVLVKVPPVAAADANGKVAVLVSESVTSGSVGSIFAASAVPVLSLEPAIFDDMNMTGPTSNTDLGILDGQTQVTITTAGHPMAAGLTGTVTVATASTRLVWGVPNANAVKVATLVGMSNRATIFGYRAGAGLLNAATAASRRVGFFSGENTAVVHDANGNALFEAAFKWTVSW
jgi:hypothetical protein